VTDAVRQWQMHGGRNFRGTWFAVGDERYVQLHGTQPIPVLVTMDDEGDYLGWIEAGKSEPDLIQHRKIFNIQFPYGYQAEVEAGRGEVVGLRIEEVRT
jgi:hypothetical protein